MSAYLGIDIGTFEAKGVLVRPDGTLIAEARRAHRMQVPRPGWAEHDAEADWWGGAAALSRQLLATSGLPAREIRAVACSAIGPCMLPVDAAGRALGPGVLYGVDTRASAEILELTEAIGTEALLARTGNGLTSQSVGPKILWLRRNRPEIWARTTEVLTATSFIVRRLTGESVIDHYSAAGFGPLYDVAAQGWNTALAPGIIDPGRLARPRWTTEIAGAVTPAAAAETGLAPGTPVTVGTIDAAAEAVSIGLQFPGEAMVMYGSTVFIIALTGRPVADARLWYAPWLFPGSHAAMAGLATSGTLTRWFRDQFARELPPETAFAALAAEAEAVPPGAEGLVLLPYFSGERTPIHDPFARGALFGLNLTHTRGHVYRALLEGIAHGTAHALAAMAEAGAGASVLRAVGGGVQNRVWLQATSDIAERPQLLAAQSIGASYGDAFLAALAVGDVTPGDIAAWNPEAGRVEPRPSATYRRQHAVFRGLYPATRELMAELGQG